MLNYIVSSLTYFNSFPKKDFLRILLCQTVPRNKFTRKSQKKTFLLLHFYSQTKENYDHAILRKQHYSNLTHLVQRNQITYCWINLISTAQYKFFMHYTKTYWSQRNKWKQSLCSLKNIKVDNNVLYFHGHLGCWS